MCYARYDGGGPSSIAIDDRTRNVSNTVQTVQNDGIEEFSLPLGRIVVGQLARKLKNKLKTHLWLKGISDYHHCKKGFAKTNENCDNKKLSQTRNIDCLYCEFILFIQHFLRRVTTQTVGRTAILPATYVCVHIFQFSGNKYAKLGAAAAACTKIDVDDDDDDDGDDDEDNKSEDYLYLLVAQ